MIEVENLSKRFGRIRAVDDISFRVASGEIVGFLGPNGAGKTTTLRVLSCFLPADGGTARIAGYDVFHESLEARRCIGYLPENAPLYEDMRVVEYLRYRGRLKGLGFGSLGERIDTVIESCGLKRVRRQLIARLSKGYRQRVGLADALVHEPEVLILDEPTIGLDPNQLRVIRDLIVSLGKRHTILLSSHMLSEIETVCDRVLIINDGRIVASDKPRNLLDRVKGSAYVSIEIQGPAPAVGEALSAMDGIQAVDLVAEGPWLRYRCACDFDADVRPAVFGLAAERGWTLRELHAESRRLEDAFAAMTRRASPAAAGGEG